MPKKGEVTSCHRCDYPLMSAVSSNNFPALMLTISALILYIPANCYPILLMTYMGRTKETTIFSGVVSLFEDGLYGLAVLIFCVSILIPISKILVLLYLFLSQYVRMFTSSKVNAKLLRVIDAIGPWSMLDVFLVAILVALVKLQGLATVEPGPGVVAFASVVVLTLIASKVFDRRLLWLGSDKDLNTDKTDNKGKNND